jgi:hypothetical protein
MKNSFIFHSSAQLVRFKVANYIKKIKLQSSIIPEIRSLAIVLSIEYLKKAGYK